MNNVADFLSYKKKFCSDVVYIGDVVEWIDYNGNAYQGRVTGITYRPFESHTFKEPMESFPMWEKEEYSVDLEGGLTVIADAIVRKVVREKIRLSGPSVNKNNFVI